MYIYLITWNCRNVILDYVLIGAFDQWEIENIESAIDIYILHIGLLWTDNATVKNGFTIKHKLCGIECKNKLDFVNYLKLFFINVINKYIIIIFF